VLNRRNTILPFLLTFGVLLAIAGLVWACFRFASQFPSSTEFTTGWTAAKLWLEKDLSPYSPELPGEVQRLTGHAPSAFIYPFYSVLFLAPFAGFDYPLAHALWMALGVIAMVVFVGLSLSLSDWRISVLELAVLIIFSLFWYNGARTFAYNQLVVIVGVFILGSIRLVQHKQDAGAGFLLAFAQIRPDLALLLAVFIAIWSLSRRRYQVIIGLLAGLSFLWVISFLLLPDWPLQWIRVLVGSSGRGDWYGSALSLVAFSIPTLKRAISIFLHGVVLVYLAIQWLRLRSNEERPYLWIVTMTLALTTLAGFRVDASNAIFLLPALFLIFKIWIDRWGLVGKIVAWFLMIVMAGSSWLAVLPLIRGTTGQEPVSLFLVLPTITILGLFWIRWWAIRGARLPYEVLRDRIGY
jgi:Glycosyltransferase family 87